MSEPCASSKELISIDWRCVESIRVVNEKIVSTLKKEVSEEWIRSARKRAGETLGGVPRGGGWTCPECVTEVGKEDANEVL